VVPMSENGHSTSDTEQIEVSETFVAETEDVSDINEATKRVNSFLNKVRRDGGSPVRVALVEVNDDV